MFGRCKVTTMSEPIDLDISAQKPPCNRCGSQNVECKGKRHGKRRFRCKDCRKWFKDDPPNELDYDDMLTAFEVYLFDVTALDRMNRNTAIAAIKEQGKALPNSKTRWSGFFIKEAECLENGPEITRARRDSMSGILVIDSMHRRIEGDMHYIWVAIDALRGETVHYDVTSDKTLPTVIKFLYELRLKGDYEAIIVVSDQEAAILSAVRLVFPHAKLQGCVVHRMRRLYKKLRTRQRRGRPISPERLRIRVDFIDLARRLIHSLTPGEKHGLTEQMRSREAEWAADPQTLVEYKSLMANLRYYLTAQERGEAPDNTNQCESANDLFSKFVSRRQGFKNLRAARAYLKAFFAVYRLKRNGTIGRKESPYQLPADIVEVTDESQPFVQLPLATNNSDPILQNDSETNDTEDEVASMLTTEQLQKFKDLESDMREMLAADSYVQTSPKAFVNRFELLARKVGLSPLSIAINKTDGSVVRIAPVTEKQESIRSCRVRSTDPDRVSPTELQCLQKRFGQLANSLTGTYYRYACAKSFSNAYYRIVDKHGRTPSSCAISKHDGSITPVN